MTATPEMPNGVDNAANADLLSIFIGRHAVNGFAGPLQVVSGRYFLGKNEKVSPGGD
jgi:hypothetical protein